ncbi:MAG: riboflavin synthase subunit alpha [Opitutales bacterium]|nr:riboflavin synthase subunit alpha [Opitutales bacterium]NRA28001.1 riboflavin synthase subunit alpha [Opitutales bacterium]
MFTGIVTATFEIAEIWRGAASATFVIPFDADHLQDLAIGASVAVNGTCLTVVTIEEHQVTFDISEETLRLTNLGSLIEGNRVNIERSAKAGAEIGGHPMSGHVDDLACVVGVTRDAENCEIRIQLPEGFGKYVFNKGYVGLNGCSLTVGALDKSMGQFSVYLIPETLRQTTFDQIKAGDTLNLEIDRQTQIMVDTVFAAVDAALAERR